MKIALLSANLGGIDKEQKNVDQNVQYDYFCFTDKNFPPRACSMTPRLQARIPKMSGSQMKPDYHIYIWLDSSCRLSKENSIETLLSKLGQNDLLVFKHPNRNSIREEADYLDKRIKQGCPYITPRYYNERTEEQLKIIEGDKDYVDDHLFASTCIVYKNNEKVDNMMKDWFLHTALYHSIDQLSFPYVISKNDCSYSVEETPYTKVDYLEYIRNK